MIDTRIKSDAKCPRERIRDLVGDDKRGGGGG